MKNDFCVQTETVVVTETAQEFVPVTKADRENIRKTQITRLSFA